VNERHLATPRANGACWRSSRYSPPALVSPLGDSPFGDGVPSRRQAPPGLPQAQPGARGRQRPATRGKGEPICRASEQKGRTFDKDGEAEFELDEEATIRFPGLVEVESA
jgi:hypothetical protein